jgi:phage terminase large subunit-like protein
MNNLILKSLTSSEKQELYRLMELKRYRDSRNQIINYFADGGDLPRNGYPKQVEFFEAGALYRERCFMAGNRVGKTIAGAYETTNHLTGNYPHWWTGYRFDRPTKCWAAGKTNETTRDIVQEKLLGKVIGSGQTKTVSGTGMIPGDLIGDINWKQGVPNLVDTVQIKHVPSGEWSTIGFKSYQQGRGSFEGTEQDVIWLDEEPPIEIYGECVIRTATTNGRMIMTFTPLEGMTETVMQFLPEGTGASHVSESRYLVMAGWDDILHLSETTKRELLASTPAYLREARSRGVPTLGSGRIFTVSEDDIKLPAFEIPRHWPRLCAIDFGWDHPFAAVWLAWDRDNDTIYIYDCYRQREATPVIHAASIKPRGTWIPIAWPHDGFQHEKGSGIELAKQYRAQELNLLPNHAQFVDEGSDGETRATRTSVEAGLIGMLDDMQSGHLKVFSHLNNWFEEYRIYHRKDGKVVKLMDDLLSASRYGWMTIKQFGIVEPTPRRKAKVQQFNWKVGA